MSEGRKGERERRIEREREREKDRERERVKDKERENQRGREGESQRDRLWNAFESRDSYFVSTHLWTFVPG